MNESTKTALIVGLGVLLLFGGIYFLPSKADFTTESKVGEVLFPELKDGNEAQGMEIVSFDENAGKHKTFAVKNLNGRWVLPSHNNYPADKKQQLVDAASSLVNLTVLGELKDIDPEQYELYGVLDPTEGKLPPGATGVGKLVTFKDGSSNTLAKLIIGKQPKEQGHGKAETDLRYVRIAGEAPIYTVRLTTNKFSPKFEDWIETNLLRPKNEAGSHINAFDIRKVQFQDYNFNPEQDNFLSLKSVALLDLNGQNGAWSLEKMEEYLNGVPKELKLTDQEQLNTAKLNELKPALNDLKILNVIRKPQGLIYALRGESKTLDNDDVNSLAMRGFYLSQGKADSSPLISRGGEVLVSLRNGVVYRLYFGTLVDELSEPTATEQENIDLKAENTNSKKSPPKTATATNRYLMVDARFNPNLIPKPMLEEVPPESSGEAEKKEDIKNEVPQPPETKPAGEVKPEPAPQPANAKQPAAKEPSKQQAPANGGKQSSLEESPFRTAAFQPPAKAASKSDDSPAAAEPKNTDSKAAEPQPTEIKPEAANDPKDANFERNQIIRRNEDRQKAYNDTFRTGLVQAKLLNDRFAEWYYVIPDEVYQKIHLGKADLIIPLKPESGESANPLEQPSEK